MRRNNAAFGPTVKAVAVCNIIIINTNIMEDFTMLDTVKVFHSIYIKKTHTLGKCHLPDLLDMEIPVIVYQSTCALFQIL